MCLTVRHILAGLCIGNPFSILDLQNALSAGVSRKYTGSPAGAYFCTMCQRTTFALWGSRVRIPSSPPKKHRNFDTMGIKVAVLSFCPKALISRGFWLLSAPAATR